MINGCILLKGVFDCYAITIGQRELSANGFLYTKTAREYITGQWKAINQERLYFTVA